jgi:hypothetical protein
MSPWEKLLEGPHARGHVVQLYDKSDTQSLTANVSRYLGEGLRRGEGALVIATPEHRDLFWRELEKSGVAISSAVENGQLAFLDARTTLSRCMTGSQPDWITFESVVGAGIGRAWPRDGRAGLRAYGEMVALLWKSGQLAAAIRLEQLWNRLLAQSSFSLYCSYEIDIFGKEFHPRHLDSILRTHTHLVPAQFESNLEAALHRAIDEVLGPCAESAKAHNGARRHRYWALIPTVEAIVLGLRQHFPAQADDILARARRHCLQ